MSERQIMIEYTGKKCNLCGLPMEIPGDAIGQTFSISGGYSSTPGNGYGALDDMTAYRFSLFAISCRMEPFCRKLQTAFDGLYGRACKSISVSRG